MSIPQPAERNLRPLAWVIALLLPLVAGPVWVAAAINGRSEFPLAASLTGFVVIATALAASYTDIRWHVIPNWVTYSAAAWGVGINAYASIVPDSAESLGAVGLGASLTGLFLLFTLLLIVFSFTGGGAGDVKLAGAIGALLGFNLGAEALLYAFVAAGIAVGTWAIVSVGPLNVVRLLARRCGGQYFSNWISRPTESDRQILLKSIPLGPFFAVGMLIVVSGLNQTIESIITGG